MSPTEADLHIALIHPQIGPNAGNAGRLCLGIGACLHLVHPLGFSTSDKAVRRAGLDYWKDVWCMEHESLAAFLSWAEGRRVWGLSARGSHPISQASFERGDVLAFGREADGLPESLREAWPMLTIPIPGPIRSMNLSNAVAVTAYFALQRINPALF